MIITRCCLFAAIITVGFLACPRIAIMPGWIILVHPIFGTFKAITSAMRSATNFEIGATAIGIFTEYVFCVVAMHVSIRTFQSFATSFWVRACRQVVLLGASAVCAHDQLSVHLENETIGGFELVASAVQHTARLSITVVTLKAEAEQALEIRLVCVA
jgi:hypothetical protein